MRFLFRNYQLSPLLSITLVSWANYWVHSLELICVEADWSNFTHDVVVHTVYSIYSFSAVLPTHNHQAARFVLLSSFSILFHLLFVDCIFLVDLVILVNVVPLWLCMIKFCSYIRSSHRCVRCNSSCWMRCRCVTMSWMAFCLSNRFLRWRFAVCSVFFNVCMDRSASPLVFFFRKFL